MYHGTFAHVITFFILFCKNNSINQQLMLPHVDKLLDLIQYNIQANKLLACILARIVSCSDITAYLGKLFNRLQNSVNKWEKIHIIELLHSLFLQDRSSCGKIDPSYQVARSKKVLYTKRQYGVIQMNQELILQKILKNSQIKEVAENFTHYALYQKNAGESQVPKSSAYSQQAERVVVYPEDIVWFKQVISLFANLSIQYQTGIILSQKKFVQQEVKSLIMNVQTPFLLKKDNIRLYYQTYMCEYQKLNQNFSILEMNDILQNLVIFDLNCFSRYIAGIVKLGAGQEMKGDEAGRVQALRQQIKSFTQSLIQVKQNLAPGSGLNNRKMNYQSQFGDKQMQGKESIYQLWSKEPGPEILDDLHEYWDYLIGGHKWNSSYDGLLFFIIDCYQEVGQRNWVRSEPSAEKSLSFEEEQLQNLLQALKIALENIKLTLMVIEAGFGLNLSQYTYLLSLCLIMNPVENLSKLQPGKNQKTLNDMYNLDRFDEAFRSRSLLTQELKMNQRSICEQFYKKIRYIVINKIMSIPEISSKFNIYFED